jgi:hypothetical protein
MVEQQYFFSAKSMQQLQPVLFDILLASKNSSPVQLGATSSFPALGRTSTRHGQF